MLCGMIGETPERGFSAKEPAGSERTEKSPRKRLFETRNIVLTGMPGSGKSTTGALLAGKLARPFYNLDAEAVRRAGMPIAEIFRTRGEPFFRDLESEIIREFSAGSGKVIATGGGSVLRKENVDALKRNGIVVFLDRPLAELLPSDDRPLADSREKLCALYEARYSIYAATADVVVPVYGTPENVANAILEKLE